MKVFLSHSTKDKQFVQALADELKAEQIEPWLCEVDIEYGDNFVAKIEEGLREADLTVLFWSPEAARSDWTRLEWTSVTAREISESRTRLGVVLLRDCAVPELLRVKHRLTRGPTRKKRGTRLLIGSSAFATCAALRRKERLASFSRIHRTISWAAPRPLRCFTQRLWRSRTMRCSMGRQGFVGTAVR